METEKQTPETEKQTIEMKYLNHYLQMIESRINNGYFTERKKQSFAEMISLLNDLVKSHERSLDMVMVRDEKEQADFELNRVVAMQDKIKMIKLITSI